ncbi:MAG: hypothetical protein PHR45_09275 [Muribaculaceae bacterium]|nr:hypothetical protein [Muribaculaceae bacterium]
MKHISLLSIAGWLNIALAIAHVLCMPWLDAAFRLYGINDLMNQFASNGWYLPYVITLVIAVCFALCGLYALSADRHIRKLPLLWLGIFTIAAIFLFRAGIGCYWMFDRGQCPTTDLSSVVISGGIGLLYLIGGISKLRSNKE